MTEANEESVPFYPDHLRAEARVVGWVLLTMLILGLLGLLLPVGIGDPADPLNTPAHVKPEWYFLALYQLLKFVSKTAGALLPVVAVALLMLWPFLDRHADSSRQSIRRRAVFIAVALLLFVALTIWGGVS